MTWVKLDDSFPDHPKLAGMGDLGPLAGWQFVCILAYCNRYLTDGHIPAVKAHALVPWKHVGVETGGVEGIMAVGDDADGEWMCGMLALAGFLEDCTGHQACYLVHDYLEYQPSKASVESERAGNRARQAKHRHARSNAVSNGTPVPVPVSISKDIDLRKGVAEGPLRVAFADFGVETGA